MNADQVPADGTAVRVKRIGPRADQSSMPGVAAGTPAIVRHTSPKGHSNLASGMVWLELENPIVWSFGVSEHSGYWATPAEFEVVTGE